MQITFNVAPMASANGLLT